MSRAPTVKKETVVIFFPFDTTNIKRCYLYGDCESFNQTVKIFFTRNILHIRKKKKLEGLFDDSKAVILAENDEIRKNCAFVEIKNHILTIKQIIIDGAYEDRNGYQFLWINYNFKLFSLCEFIATDYGGINAYSRKSYFKLLKDKINNEVNLYRERRERRLGRFTNFFLALFSDIISKLLKLNVALSPVIKYLKIAVHIDNHLNALLWAVQSAKVKKKFDIKVTNFLLSVLIDMLLGILFLNWLNSKVSLSSSASIFLVTAECVVNLINDLINWLRGDPAGLKLNCAFNGILATFFSYHINIWWTFLVYMKSVVQIIFQIFLKLGLLGITFQASIMADLLALVSLHVFCIHAYAAKLYSIQISTLVSLWRLFLGRKKNPLRGKVDSCRYSPKQLFVGTLAFTILLFLLPTTLLYYMVFTSIKLLIRTVEATLQVIQYFNLALPVYTTILWLIRSPKIFGTIEIEQCKSLKATNCLLLNLKPGLCSWWETVKFFTPDSAAHTTKFKWSSFWNSILTGRQQSL